MKQSILLPLILFPSIVFSQLTGRIVNEKNEGISFANILVKNTAIGTTADSTGTFTLAISGQKFPFSLAFNEGFPL